MNRNWTGKLLVTLLSAYTSWKKLCWLTFKASSGKVVVSILRKWRQNAWMKMWETVFFVDEKLFSWRRLQDFLKTCLEDVLKTCLEDVLKTCLEDVLKSCLEDALKTYLDDVFKTSRRQTKFLLVIFVSNKSKCVSNKSLFHKLCLRNLRRIQNAWVRNQ